jgi:hypothetical protein
MRELALALPETEERSHFEQPDFRVRGRIFGGLSTDEKRGTLKLTPEIQATLVGSKSSAFYPASGAWGLKGWTQIDLARVEVGVLKALLVEAWRLVAPVTLVAKRETAAPGGAKPRAARKRASKPKVGKKAASRKGRLLRPKA